MQQNPMGKVITIQNPATGEVLIVKQNSLGKTIAKARSDEIFKQKLIADPMAVLKAEWDELSEEERGTLLAKLQASGVKKQSELSDEQLSSVSGGMEVVVVEDWTMDQLKQDIERKLSECIRTYSGIY